MFLSIPYSDGNLTLLENKRPHGPAPLLPAAIVLFYLIPWRYWHLDPCHFPQHHPHDNSYFQFYLMDSSHTLVSQLFNFLSLPGSPAIPAPCSQSDTNCSLNAKHPTLQPPPPIFTAYSFCYPNPMSPWPPTAPIIYLSHDLFSVPHSPLDLPSSFNHPSLQVYYYHFSLTYTFKSISPSLPLSLFLLLPAPHIKSLGKP